jgi:hypothetical protein
MVCSGESWIYPTLARGWREILAAELDEIERESKENGPCEGKKRPRLVMLKTKIQPRMDADER